MIDKKNLKVNGMTSEERKVKCRPNFVACEKKLRSRIKSRGGLTPKQAKLIGNKVKGMTNIDAYADAYEPTTTSTQSLAAMGGAELGKPHIRKALDDALENAGITETYVVMEAKKIFEASESDSDKLRSLKFIAELKRLVGSNAQIEQTSPKTVNILNLKLDKLGDGELMDMLRKKED